MLKTDKNKRRKLYDRKEETREVYYALSRKLLDLMLQSGYLDREEYEKIDALNRETFLRNLPKYMRKTIDVSKKVWYCVVRKEEN